MNSSLKLILQTIVASSFAYYLSFQLRFDFAIQDLVPTYSLVMGLCILLFCRTLAYVYFDAQSIYWRYFALRDLEKLFRCHSASTILFTSLILLFRLPEFPRSIIFIEYIISFVTICAIILTVRVRYESRLSETTNSGSSDKKSIVIGCGDSGQLLVKTILSGRARLAPPICILDEDTRSHGNRIHGIKVAGGIKEVKNLLQRYKEVSEIYVTAEGLQPEQYLFLESTAKQFGCALRQFDSFEDIFLKTFSDDYSPEPLHREKHLDHSTSLINIYKGKSILITGAGGSIGSEIVRQLCTLSPKHLFLIDSNEFNLFKLQHELRRMPHAPSTTYQLADVKDVERVRNVLNRHQPDYVFHAAAYKHVPLCEENPGEAFKTNVLGTRNVLNACVTTGVKNFTLISTDKAVDPMSIMGVTKKIAESLVELTCNNAESLQASIVRFGNVANSAGSVIPLFRDQILIGGPVTVTHPEVKRYFMSTHEAVQLTLMTGAFKNKLDKLILDMGKEILLTDLAKEMIAFYNRPNIEISYIGLRPGEKLTEELINAEEILEDTEFDKIKRVKSTANPSPALLEEISKLSQALGSMTHEDAAVAIKNLLTVIARSVP